MANSSLGLGGFADLSRYQQAPTQVQPNIMDQFVQALNQGVSLAQLPQTIQQENELKKQQLILGSLRTALAQQQLNDLQNPDQALARKVKEQLTLQSALNPTSGYEAAPAGAVGETIASPGAITPEQQSSLIQNQIASDQGGLPPPEIPKAPLGASTTPIAVGGIQTGFNYNPVTPSMALARENAAKIAYEGSKAGAIEGAKLPFKLAEEKAKQGTVKNTIVPAGSKVIDANGNVLFDNPKESTPRNTTVGPGSKVIDADGNVIFDNPVTGAAAGGPGSKLQKYIDTQYREFNQRPEVKDFNDIRGKFQDIAQQVQAAKTNPSQFASDAAIADRYVSIINSKGRVVQGQLNNLFGGRSGFDLVLAKANQIASSQAGKFTPAERDAILKASQEIYNTHQKDWIGVKKDFEQNVLDNGGDVGSLRQVVGSTKPIFGSEQEARRAGLQNGDKLIINGIPYTLGPNK